MRIDLEDIDQRILALPIPPRNYVGPRGRQGGHRCSCAREPAARAGRRDGAGGARPCTGST